MPLVTTTPGNYDDIITTTLQLYVKRIEDNFYDALPHWHMLNRTGAVKMYDGGESFIVPVLFADNTTAKRFAANYDDISVTPQNVLTAAQYLPRLYGASVTISLAEELDNDGMARALDLLQSKVESAELSLRNLLNGDGLGNTNGIAGAITGLADGLEDNGTGAVTTGTVGGINKATFTWWRAIGGSDGTPALNVASAFGTNGRSMMSSGYNAASAGSSDHPQMIVTTRATYENYERSMESHLQMFPLNSRDSAKGDPKFQMLAFRGALVYFDNDCPANRMYMLNPRYYYLKVHRKGHFRATPFVKFPNQLARVAQIYWRGSICFSNMKRHAVLINTDTF